MGGSGSGPGRAALLLFVAFVALVAAATPAGADPRYDYVLHCGGCHLEDGAGDPPEVPDLRADLHEIMLLPGGRSYLARVPGSAQAPISDAALAAVLNWILADLDPQQRAFEPYTAEEIAGYRGQTLTDPLRFRAELWELWELHAQRLREADGDAGTGERIDAY